MKIQTRRLNQLITSASECDDFRYILANPSSSPRNTPAQLIDLGLIVDEDLGPGWGRTFAVDTTKCLELGVLVQTDEERQNDEARQKRIREVFQVA